MNRKRLLEIANELLSIAEIPEEQRARFIEATRKCGDVELALTMIDSAAHVSCKLIGLENTFICMMDTGSSIARALAPVEESTEQTS